MIAPSLAAAFLLALPQSHESPPADSGAAEAPPAAVLEALETHARLGRTVRYRNLAAELAEELRALGVEIELAELGIGERAREQAVEDTERGFEQIYPAGHWQTIGRLYAMVRIDLGEGDAEVRGSVLQAMVSQLSAYYHPDERSLFVLDPEGLSGGGLELFAGDVQAAMLERALEPLLAHELVHAWRDARTPLVPWLGAAPVTMESMRRRMCVSEGEAQLRAQELVLRRAGQSLSDLPLEGPLPTLIGGQALLMTYQLGSRYVLRAHRGGGWEAVEGLWDAPPASTEQVLHPEKAQDLPREVRFSGWPAGVAEFEGTTETTVGEMNLLSLFLERGRPASEAAIAAAGWDGDRLRTATVDGKPVVHWRTVWDRAVDAEEFSRDFDRLARGRGLTRGSVVDWVWSRDKGVERGLVAALEQERVEFAPEPADEASAAAVALRLTGSRPRVEDGRWHLPAAGVVLDVPADWTVQDFNGMAMLMGEETGGLTPNLGLSFAEPAGYGFTETFIEEAFLPELEALGCEFDPPLALEVDGRAAFLLRYRGEVNGLDLAFRSLLFESGAQVAVLTATCGRGQVEELGPVFRRSFDSMRFEVLPPRAALGEPESDPFSNPFERAGLEELEEPDELPEPYVADGRWVLPEPGVSLAAPEGWRARSQPGLNLLVGPIDGDFAPNLNLTVVETATEGLNRAYLEGALREELEAAGMSAEAAEPRETAVGTAWRVDAAGPMAGFDLAFTFLLFEVDGVVYNLTGTCRSDQLQAARPLFLRAFEGLAVE